METFNLTRSQIIKIIAHAMDNGKVWSHSGYQTEYLLDCFERTLKEIEPILQASILVWECDYKSQHHAGEQCTCDNE